MASFAWYTIFCILVLPLTGWSQCADRPVYLNRMTELRESDVPFSEQKEELLIYLTYMNKCPEVGDSIKVKILQRVGALCYQLRQFDSAVIYTNNSISLLNDLHPYYRDTPLLTRMYQYLAIFYDSLHFTRSKMSCVDSAIYYSLSTERISASTLDNLRMRVEFSFSNGEYERAMEDAEIGLSTIKKHVSGSDSLLYEETFTTYLINCLLELKKIDEAERRAKRSVEQFSATGNRHLCGVRYNQLALIAMERDRNEEALRYLKESFESNVLRKFTTGCKQSMNNIGYFYASRLHDPLKALIYYDKALRYTTKDVLELEIERSENANILANMANACVAVGRYQDAFKYFDRAFLVIGDNYDEYALARVPVDEFARHPYLHYLISLVSDKADAFFRMYLHNGDSAALSKALSIYHVTDKLFSRIKSGQSGLFSQLSWRKKAKTIYERAISACYHAKKSEEAFYFFERSRAVLMNDRIAAGRLSAPEVKLALTLMERSLIDTSVNYASRGGAEYFNLLRKKDLLVAQLQRLSDDSVRSIDFAAFRQWIVDNNQSYLALFAGKESAYCLYLDKNNVQLIHLNADSLTSLIVKFQYYLYDHTKINKDFKKFVEVSHGLYKLLFDRINASGKRIIISLDGAPFPVEALISDINKGGNPVYLLENMTVSYTYSAVYLLSRSMPVNANVFGMAPVKFNSSMNLSTLHGSAEALQNAVKHFNTRHSIVGAGASKGAFLKNFRKYGIIQLYTHANQSLDSGDPVIYFSDSALYLSELSPHASGAAGLIILTACETGGGAYFDGEGVFSFNRAFAETGVPAAAVNLWSVEDRASYRITELFCKYLSEGLDADLALQKAKMKFYEEGDRLHRLPYFWAAPILTGRPVVFIQKRNYWVYIIPIVMIVVAGAFMLRRRGGGRKEQGEV